MAGGGELRRKATERLSTTKSTGKHKSISKYYRKYQRYYIWGFVVLFLSVFFHATLPWLMKVGIDSLDPTVETAAHPVKDAISPWVHSLLGNNLALYALAMVIGAAIGGFFRFWARRTIIWGSRDIEYELRNEVFGHLLQLPAAFYQRTPSGDVIARLTNDLEAVRLMIGPAVMYLMNTIVTGIVAFTAMLIISWKLTLYSLIPLPLLSLVMWRLGTATHKRFVKIQDHFSALSSFVQESLAGVRVIKAYRREPYQNEKFREVSDRYVKLNLALARVRAMFMPGITLLVGLLVLTVFWAGGHEVIDGTISKGEYVAFMVYLMMLIWPMLAIGWVVSLYQRGTASLTRIDGLLAEPPEIESPPAPATIANRRGRVRFNGLSFAYPNTTAPVLREIAFEVTPGETVAVVGSTGAGKTTLVSLLMRTYAVPDNTIFIDDVDINQLALDDLRGMIGFVRQDSYLFSDTIAANIAFARATIDLDEVQQAATLAAFDGEVEGFPDQYQTILGERGITLSGGQKQRAAIARALLKKPTILVLDDAFSSVDTQTEELILERLHTAAGNITTFLISHRPSTIRRADRIVVLDQGRIAETGTHEELIARQGRYFEIIRRELLADELELLG